MNVIAKGAGIFCIAVTAVLALTGCQFLGGNVDVEMQARACDQAAERAVSANYEMRKAKHAKRQCLRTRSCIDEQANLILSENEQLRAIVNVEMACDFNTGLMGWQGLKVMMRVCDLGVQRMSAASSEILSAENTVKELCGDGKRTKACADAQEQLVLANRKLQYERAVSLCGCQTDKWDACGS